MVGVHPNPSPSPGPNPNPSPSPSPNPNANPSPDPNPNPNPNPNQVGGHTVYGAFFEGRMGYRCDSTWGVATGNEPESMYMVTAGIRMVHAWCMHGACMVYAWCTRGEYRCNAWCMHGVGVPLALKHVFHIRSAVTAHLPPPVAPRDATEMRRVPTPPLVRLLLLSRGR